MKTLVAGFVLLFSTEPLSAWDLFGHHVVGAIAWEQMDDSTRRAVSELLLQAPPDSDIPGLLPPGGRPYDVRARELFIKAQGWADLVRDEIWSNRKERYDHPSWHYVNHFWTPTASGPRPLPEKGTLGELVDRLEASKRASSDRDLPASERAVALAWVLHLSGDVHQPLHSSARVTEVDPNGDRGGNDFALDDEESSNLHAFWDSILRRARRQRHSESYFAWVSRVAAELSGLHPESSLAGEVANGSVEEWSRSGATIAMTTAYPDYLIRGAAPPKRYQDEVFEKATRRAALAGYRLARFLNEVY
jgi:hypothetical protein